MSLSSLLPRALGGAVLSLVTALGASVVVATPALAEAQEVVAATPTTTSLQIETRLWTAAVTGPEGAGPPQGTVAFYVDGEEVAVEEVFTGGSDVSVALSPGGRGGPGPLTWFRAEFRPAEGSSWQGSTGEYLRVDPRITATLSSDVPPSAFGWYRAPVTVTYDCQGGTGEARFCDPPQTYTSYQESVYGRIESYDGGADGVSTEIRIDRRSPRVWVQRIGARPPACRAYDARSGVATCTVDFGRRVRGAGGRLRQTWTATAVDRADNTASKSGSYAVSR